MSSASRQPHSGAVMLEESLHRGIRQAITAAGVPWCEAFVLVEVDNMGLRASVVDAATGISLVEHGDGRLRPHMLDVALADHLVRIGRVTRPRSPEWMAELVGLMAQVRARLVVADGAFAMGTEHVSMFRMSRTDCITALSAELSDAASLIERTVAESDVEVDAVVAMPDHESWPGLVGELAERLALPVVALDGRGDDSASDGGRHTNAAGPVGDEIDGPEPRADAAPAPESEPVHDTGTLDAPVEPWFPASSDVTQPISVVRTAGPPVHGVEQVGAGIPTATPEVSVGPSAGDHDVRRDNRTGEASMSGVGPRAYAPPGGVGGRVDGPGGRRRIAVGAVAVGGAVALGGAILAVPWLHGNDSARSAPSVVGVTAPHEAAQTTTPTGQPAPSAAPQNSTAHAPIDTRPAQIPAVQYVPPAAQQQQSPSYVSPGQPRRVVPRPAPPRRRTIPNPIPGLPPIVLP
jgi:hypothetical protein